MTIESKIASHAEIEITPEMIAAGMDVAWKAPLMDPDEAGIRQMVIDVFRAMVRAAP